MRAVVACLAITVLGTGLAQAQSCTGNPGALGLARTVVDPHHRWSRLRVRAFQEPRLPAQQEVALTFDDGPWADRYCGGAQRARAPIAPGHIFRDRQERERITPESFQETGGGRPAIPSARHTGRRTRTSRKPDLRYREGEGRDRIRVIARSTWRQVDRLRLFFRFPANYPPKLVKYLANSNITMFSTDMDLFDFKMRKTEQLVQPGAWKTEKAARALCSCNDFQRVTAEGLAPVAR